MQQISTSLVQLTSVGLSNLWDIGATDLALLCALPQLQQLHLNCDLPAIDLTKLGPLPITVAHVIMDEESTEADLCSWLRQSAANLQQLTFEFDSLSTGVPALPLVPLQQASQLMDLSIDGLQPNITEVAALTQLTRLSLESCNLDDRAV